MGGRLKGAASVADLVKAVYTLENGQIPTNLAGGCRNSALRSTWMAGALVLAHSFCQAPKHTVVESHKKTHRS